MQRMNGKIIEATEDELLGVYKRGYSEVVTFEEFLQYCKINGTEIKEEKTDENTIQERTGGACGARV